MKFPLVVVASLVAAFSVAAHAEDMSGMPMDGMQAQQQAPAASAEGVIKAIDPARHTVTLAHGPVPALQWPPMTMGFAVTDAQLAGLAVGDNVAFSFRMEGSKASIVSIKK